MKKHVITSVNMPWNSGCLSGHDRRILVIGCPGSGKTRLAQQLAKILNIPNYSLDDYHWRSNWKRADHSSFMLQLGNILEQREWIIDGNYISTLDLRLSYSNVVIFLDRPVTGNFLRITYRGFKRLTGEKTSLPREIRNQKKLPVWMALPGRKFIQTVLFHNKLTRPKIIEKLNSDATEQEIFQLRNRSSINQFINACKKMSGEWI